MQILYQKRSTIDSFATTAGFDIGGRSAKLKNMQSIHAFSEKVAVVAGGAGPTGRAVAIQLALLGAYVIVVDDGEGGSAADELRSLGTLAANIRGDVSDPEQAEAAVSEIGSMFGRIDLLVNCVDARLLDANGADPRGPLAKAIAAPCVFIRSALGLMAPRPKARIVNIVPPAGSETDKVLHEACRRAVEGMTEAFANELPGHFRINAIAVDGIRETERTGVIEVRSGVADDDIARTAIFLLSSESAAVNGRTLTLG